MKVRNSKRDEKDFTVKASRALRRAALVARKTARMYGTPVYFMRDGKIVAEKP